MAQAQDFNHDPNAGAGENIFFGSPPGPEIQRWAANDWIGEKAQYHGGGFTEATGHYTQVRADPHSPRRGNVRCGADASFLPSVCLGHDYECRYCR